MVLLKPENGASVALPVQAKEGGGVLFHARGGAAGNEKRAGLFHGDPLPGPPAAAEGRRDPVAVWLQQPPELRSLI